jgi:hypothetical protein
MTDDQPTARDGQPSTDSPGGQQRQGLISPILGWLRAGYPDGVPPQDYVALLGILQRSLTPTELERVVQQLSQEVGNGHTIITPEQVRQGIENVVKGKPVPADVSRVSARLAAAGWPLWAGSDGVEGEHGLVEEPVRPGLVTKIVDWLRAGYPTQLPSQDYIALIALLRRRLTDAEVVKVSQALVRSGTLHPDRADVGAAIAEMTSELPSDDDITRVRNYLTDHGWPVDFPL